MGFHQHDIELAEILHQEAGDAAVHDDGNGVLTDVDVIVDRDMERAPDQFAGQRAASFTYVTVLLSQVTPKRGDTISLNDSGEVYTIEAPVDEDRVARRYVARV